MSRGAPCAEPRALPPELARERGEVLHRALRELPVELLAPLLRGIRRHADSLVPGALYDGSREGGCAVGMMLRELGAEPRRRGLFGCPPTIHEGAPDIARRHPRLGHIEIVFDRTCQAVMERLGLDEEEAARATGLWMASEVAAEINTRHMESLAEQRRPTSAAAVDEELFADTVARLRALRPWLSEAQAERLGESVVGARRAAPLAVPAEWAQEVELQRRRLAEQPA